jgi:hypothetical protein
MRRKPQPRKPKKKAAVKRPVKLAGVRDVMAALNLSKVHVGRLVSEGMPKLGRGHYDLDTCRDWYIKYLQNLVKSHETEDAAGNVSSTSGERRRVLRTQAELLEIELAEKRGTLIPLEVHVSECSNLVLIIRQNVLVLETRIANLVPGEDRERVRAEIRRSLMAMANFEIKNCDGSLDEPHHVPAAVPVNGYGASDVHSLAG